MSSRVTTWPQVAFTFTKRLRVGLRHVDWVQAVKDADVFFVGKYATHVVGVVNIRMLRIGADEVFYFRLRFFGFTVAVVGVGEVKRGLLRDAAKGVAGKQFGIIFTGATISAVIHLGFGCLVEFFRAPIDCFVLLQR